MKKIILIGFALILTSGFLGICQNGKKETQGVLSEKVQAYYFHLTTRCITCKTVEAEAKKDLESLYGTKIIFQAINIEEESSKAITEKLKISGQTLLLVKGDKKIDLTNEGFLYAVNNPDKLKSIIKARVDELLKL